VKQSALRHAVCFVSAVCEMTEPRTAVVTGAGKRVGLEIAQALVSDGWSVIAQVRRGDDAVPDGSLRVACDLADIQSVDRLFEAADKLPPVRLLVNNAARFASDSAEVFDPDEFDAHMAVNVRSPLRLAQRFAGRHRKGDGLIVNILDAKLSAPNPDFLSYTVSKAALASATGLLARAFAGKGIRVNAIAPSLMLCSPGQTEDNFRKMHSANPLGRGVKPSDLIQALRFFICAKTVTGQCITIDGGQSFMQLARDVQFLGD
jgi:NAD(P)-dependent dehydrogenase (short-subunit alcohol dehydrogenase family)